MSSKIDPRASAYRGAAAELRVGALILSVTLGLAACGGGGGGGGADAPVQAAAIAAQPAPQTTDAGADATFSVNATGTGLRYQWRRDGKDIPGATTASYTLANVEPADEGSVFTVEVSNSAGSAVSAGAALRVTTPKGLSLLAGHFGGPGNLDGQDARFDRGGPMAVAPSGALLMSEPSGTRRRLRSVDPVTGTTTTLVVVDTSAFAYAMVFDTAGNRYDMTSTGVYKTTPAGVRNLFAGGGTPTDHVSVDGTGGQARFDNPRAMAIDGKDNLYLIEYGNGKVRRIDPAGVVTTLTGSRSGYQPADGGRDSAVLAKPTAIAADPAGNVYVADQDIFRSPYQPNLLRRVAADGTVTTMILKGSDDADPFTSVGFGEGGGALATDAAGNVYVTDTSKGCRIRKVAPDGAVTNVAGAAAGNADGKGAAAAFCQSQGSAFLSWMTADKTGNLFVFDAGNSTIRRVTPAGDVTTVAGRAPGAANVDGKGRGARFAAAQPSVYVPQNSISAVQKYSLAADPQGNLFVGEHDRIRTVTPAGTVATMQAATGTAGVAWETYTYPGGLPYGGKAVVVSRNVVSRVDANGVLQFVAGEAGSQKRAVDGTGAGASFWTPYNIVVDGLGNTFMNDMKLSSYSSSESYVVQRMMSPDGVVTTLPAIPYGKAIIAWTPDKEGGVWAASMDGSVQRIGADGTRKEVVPATENRFPTAIARDAAGNLYIAAQHAAPYATDQWGMYFTVHKIAPDGKDTVVAGAEGKAGVRTGAPGSLGRIDALAAGADGIVYVMTENAVLKLKP